MLSQFCCTSLWFAGNGIIEDLIGVFSLAPTALGHLTSMVQFGFITGTLTFAVLTIGDRFSPSRVFMVCAFIGALFNAGIILEGNTLTSLLMLRFGTGFFLAGIYPIGMKIAADYYDKGLGRSLGFLVGALVLGTALPHLLRDILGNINWKFVIASTSALAVTGGLAMMLTVPDGPFRKKAPRVDFTAFFRVFKRREFSAAAAGYFGHMWELYAFWAFVPVMLSTYNSMHPDASLNVAFWSFLIIGIGGPACVGGSLIAERLGVKNTAAFALSLSGICCLISPFLFYLETPGFFLFFMLFWGACVIADSPLFSTLVATNCDVEIKGTALTIVNCLGFSITIISILLINTLYDQHPTTYIYLILCIGPVLGLIGLLKK